MNDPAPAPPRAEVVKDRRRPSLAWLVPLIALIIAGLLGYQAWQERGQTITIRFNDAVGLKPGDAIAYRGLRVGTIEKVHLNPSLSTVTVQARLRPDALSLAVEGSAFWIVRPEVSLQGVSGLDTLLGPRYIAVDPGPKGAASAHDFIGSPGKPGRPGPDAIIPEGVLPLTLLAARRGSLEPGAPVFYRDVNVGRVYSFELTPDARRVAILIGIDPPYHPLVRTGSRFWRQSIVALDWGIFRGIELQSHPIESMLTGSVAFATPDGRRQGDPARSGHAFELAETSESNWLEWEPSITIEQREPDPELVTK